MFSNIHNYIENNYTNKNKRFVTENRPKKTITNYNIDQIKHVASDTQQTTDDYYTDHSYNTNKRKEKPTSYYYSKKTQNNENSKKPRQSINYKYRAYNNIQPSYNDNTNDIIKINTITYFSELNDKTQGRVSSDKKFKFESNKILSNKTIKDDASKKPKVLNRVELNNNKNNNISNTYKKNSSFKMTHKTRSNFSNDLSKDIDMEEKIARYVRRNEQNDRYMSCNESNINLKNICYNKLNSKEKEKGREKEKVNMYGKLPANSSYNSNFVKINNFEFTYESDQGEKKDIRVQNKKRNIIINNKPLSEYKYNVCYSNIDLEDYSNKYNNNNYEEIRDSSTYNSISTTKTTLPYQYQVNQSGYLNNPSKKVISIIDSFEHNDISNNINNKSITFGSLNKRKTKKLTKTNNFSGRLKKEKINNIKNAESKVLKNSNRFNNSIDISINSQSSNNYMIRSDYNTFSNISADNTSNTNAVVVKKNSTTSISNHNSSRLKKRSGCIISNKKKGKYLNKNDIKKIILIQSVYRTHLLISRISGSLNFYMYFSKLYSLLKLIFTFRLNYYWKNFIEKIPKNSIKKIIKNTRVRNYCIKKNKNENDTFGAKNKFLLKSPEGKNLYKELGDSTKSINDNNGLKLKLDNVIKENNELKNKIFHNKNIEEKLKQLLVENKKNQNINAIIMKDNQQLAKKLKNIRDNRNNQLIIQNQPSLDLSQENNIQKQSDSLIKFKKLCIKCLILKKILKNRNILKVYFNKYKNIIINLQNEKPEQTTIENNNIFINNRKKINIQMTKNFNINFISQKDNYKHFILDKLFMKKEEIKKKTLSKFFFKFIYISKYCKLFEDIKTKEKEINEEKEKQNELKVEEEEGKKEDINQQKRIILQSIINKYERNYNILFRNLFKEWKLRGIIFKMKAIAKDIKKKKKLKKKIREKIARATLNSLKNKTASFQSAHEFSYNINKKQELENTDNNDNKEPKSNTNVIKITEDNKNENNINDNNDNKDNIEEQDDSESSFGLDD